MILFVGTGEKGHLFQGNRGTKTIFGNREHKNFFSTFRKQGNMLI